MNFHTYIFSFQLIEVLHIIKIHVKKGRGAGGATPRGKRAQKTAVAAARRRADRRNGPPGRGDIESLRRVRCGGGPGGCWGYLHAPYAFATGFRGASSITQAPTPPARGLRPAS